MKVLHVGFSDGGGGAGIAMRRIHESLRLTGVNSIMLVINKSSDSDLVLKFEISIFRRWLLFIVNLIAKIVLKFFQQSPYRVTRSMNLVGCNIVDMINRMDADIIHLHWIGFETLRIEELRKIKKPIIWTCHDLWAMLGSEHVNPSNSDRYKNKYIRDNRPPCYRGLDIERWVWSRKRKAWAEVSIGIVALSSWEALLFKQSALLGHRAIFTIGNPIDTSFWSPGCTISARRRLGLPECKKILLFSGINAFFDSNKGFSLLAEALNNIETQDVVLVVIGAIGSCPFLLNIPMVPVPVTSDFEILREYYRASDLVISTSFQETFGQVIAEGLACGIPAIAFSQTGCADLIEDGVTGIIVKNYESKDFSVAIDKCLRMNVAAVRRRAPISIDEKYSQSSIALQYQALYSNYCFNLPKCK